jgi:biotin synthase-related radical SAM superfamily protein
MELTDVTGTRSGETKIGSVVLKHYSPVQRAASRGGDPIAVCELVLGSASTIIKNTYTLQANVKSIAEGAPDSEELKNNFRTLSTATIRLMMNVTESVKKLDIPQSEPFLFLKKKSLMQHAAKAEEVVIQFIRSGKSLVQAHETQPDLAAFQNIVKSMATSIKQLADAVTDLKDHLA